MRSTGEPEGDETTGGRQMMLESDACLRSQRRATALEVPHQVALALAGDAIAHDQFVHPPAPLIGSIWIYP